MCDECARQAGHSDPPDHQAAKPSSVDRLLQYLQFSQAKDPKNEDRRLRASDIG